MTAKKTYEEGIQQVANLTGRTFLCLLETYEHIQRAVAPRQWVGTDELPRPELDRLYWRGASSKIVVRCDTCGKRVISTVAKETCLEPKRCKPTCNHVQTPEEIIERIEETGLFKFDRWVGKFNFAHSYALVYCQLCGGIQKKRAFNIYDRHQSCTWCGSKPRYDEFSCTKRIEDNQVFDVVCFPDGYQNKSSLVTVSCRERGHLNDVIAHNAMRGSKCRDCCNQDVRGVARRLTVDKLRELYEKNDQTLISFVGGKYESISKTQSIQRCHNCCVEWKSLVTHVLHGGASCACMYRENYFLSWTTVEKRPGDPIHVYYAEFIHILTGESFYKIGLSKFKNRFGQHVGDYKVSVKIIDTTTVYIGYLREQQTITDYMEYKTEPAILRNGKKGTGECFSVDVLGLFNTK